MKRNRTLWKFVVFGMVTLGIVVGTWKGYIEYLKSQSGITQGILTGIPCAPPCWKNISPGDIVETYEITLLLKTIPGISDYKVQGGIIEWSWQWQSSNIHENTIYLNNQVVEYIELGLDKTLTVEQMVEQYGFPEATDIAIAGLPEMHYILVRSFYPLHGIVFVTRLSESNPVLKPTTQISKVEYTLPAKSLSGWESSSTHYLPLRPWPGYGNVCRELEKNGFVCP